MSAAIEGSVEIKLMVQFQGNSLNEFDAVCLNVDGSTAAWFQAGQILWGQSLRYAGKWLN
ncbi:hypothetical protein [Leptolyngbya sp. ST-U4]|uniref:hypothetical protein n=1 Tax=Leptolyngbya sp. ST-U4 TaxID=2933912 RepID=UPI0032975366